MQITESEFALAQEKLDLESKLSSLQVSLQESSSELEALKSKQTEETVATDKIQKLMEENEKISTEKDEEIIKVCSQQQIGFNNFCVKKYFL